MKPPRQLATNACRGTIAVVESYRDVAPTSNWILPR